MVLVLNTLCAYALFTHQIFGPLPDSSLQYSWSLELHFHKAKVSAWILPDLGTIKCFGAVPDKRHCTVSVPLIRGPAVSRGIE